MQVPPVRIPFIVAFFLYRKEEKVSYGKRLVEAFKVYRKALGGSCF